MIIHVLVDIAQEARSDDTHRAKRNADQLHPPGALRKRNLARSDDNLVRRLVARDAGDQSDFVEEGGAGEGDDLGDGFGVRDAELEFHGAADVVNCV